MQGQSETVVVGLGKVKSKCWDLGSAVYHSQILHDERVCPGEWHLYATMHRELAVADGRHYGWYTRKKWSQQDFYESGGAHSKQWNSAEVSAKHQAADICVPKSISDGPQ